MSSLSIEFKERDNDIAILKWMPEWRDKLKEVDEHPKDPNNFFYFFELENSTASEMSFRLRPREYSDEEKNIIRGFLRALNVDDSSIDTILKLDK